MGSCASTSRPDRRPDPSPEPPPLCLPHIINATDGEDLAIPALDASFMHIRCFGGNSRHKVCLFEYGTQPVVISARGASQFRHSSESRLMLAQSDCAPHATSHLNRILFCATQSPYSVVVITEYFPGKDLYDYLHENEDLLSESEASRILSQVALGMRQLKTLCGAAHMDISVENIIISPSGLCRLIDFEFATADKWCFSLQGKPNAMAPEVFHVSLSDPYRPMAADVWSLGIVAFTVLTKTSLYNQPDGRLVRDLQRGKRLEDALVAKRHRQTFCALSPKARAFLQSLLQADPDKRPTIEDVCSDPFLAGRLDRSNHRFF